jgi:predicted Zn-dependent protease
MAEPAEGSFELRIWSRIEAGDVAGARTLVAEAEAARAEGAEAAQPRSVIAAAKARIAFATGDEPAARAILVMAIEAEPAVPHLRTLLAEIMLASGRATDVRPVLQHLGQPPSDPERRDAPDERPADVAP